MADASCTATTRVGVRWTVGDASSRGWESLRLSIHCARKLLGADARYAVFVNSLPVAEARQRTGTLPDGVEWHQQTASDIPTWLAPHLDPEMAEGVGWKLIPPQCFPDRHELALDNDCILFAMPEAVRLFLESDRATLLAEDVERCLGRFDALAPPGMFNSGIRGLPPGYPLAAMLAAALREQAHMLGQAPLLRSELDEQGLQAVALQLQERSLVVSRKEVSICSPFWPRQPELGTCGAHFVGLNPRHLPWNYYDRSADHVRREHWDRLRPLLYKKAGLDLPPALPLHVA